MRSGGLLQLILVLAVASPITCVYEDKILDFLEQLSLRMCHPIPNLGLPALDPLVLGPAETALDNKYLVNFTGSIKDFELKGLSDFVVNTLKINIVPGVTRSTINVTFPLTSLKTLYTAKGSLAYILNLAGDGNAEASVKDFSFLISWRIKASTNIGITGLQIEFLLGDLYVYFQNLLEEIRINEFVHALINEMGKELLGDVWDYEQENVVNLVEAFINNNILKILKLINGSGDGDEKPPIFEGVEPNCKPKKD